MSTAPTDALSDSPADTPSVRHSDVRVPDGDAPARCPYCDRPFRTEQLRALHLGTDHAEACTDDEREAYERAREAEADDLFVYHLKTVAALVALYAFFLLGYMAVAAMQA